MTPATNRAVGAAVARFLDLGLRDDILLLAIGLEIDVREFPREGRWFRAAGRVHTGPTANSARYWLGTVLRQDLPRHIPAHEQPDGPTLTCVAPMIRRDVCGKAVPLRGWSSSAGRAIPVLVGEHVTWHAYCRKHDCDPQTRIVVRGTPEAYAAAKRLRHNSGGKLRDAFPSFKVEDGYRWADKRWQPDDRPVEAVRLRLVPPLEPLEEA